MNYPPSADFRVREGVAAVRMQLVPQSNAHGG